MNDQGQKPGWQTVQQPPVGSQSPVQQTPVSVGGAQGEPVGAVRKEHAPVSVSSEQLKPSEPELTLEKEVEDAGVTVENKPHVLPPQQSKTGVHLTGDATPVAISPSGAVVLPMTGQQAKQALKLHKKVSRSIVWLASIVLRQIKEIQMKGKS